MTGFSYRKLLTFGFPFGVLNRDLKLIFVCNFIGAFGDGLYSYLLPRYIETLGASSVEVGMLFSTQCLVAVFTLILAGLLADKYDRKKIMVLGWVAWLPAPIIFSLAKRWTQLLPGMIFYGCWFGGPTSSAYIATAADRDKVTLTFTILSAAWSVGYIFSPALGGYLSTVVGMSLVFYLAFIFYALTATIISFISSQHAATQPSQRLLPSVSFKSKKILVWSLFFSAAMFITLLMRPFIPPFLGDMYSLNNFKIGILGSITFLGSALLGICLGRVGDKWTKAGAVSVSMILCCISTGMLISFNNFFVLAATSFLMGGLYITWSLLGAVIGSIAPEASRARWISIPQTASMLASFLAPYLGGTLYGISPYNPFLVAIAATPLLAILVLTKPFSQGSEKD